MGRGLRGKTASQEITANNVTPGFIHTDLAQHLAAHLVAVHRTSTYEVGASWEQQIPAGLLGEPREFAALVAFLASDRASYIPGASIPVDGGWIPPLN